MGQVHIVVSMLRSGDSTVSPGTHANGRTARLIVEHHPAGHLALGVVLLFTLW
jgi:hypothetical protein